jgi:hypothetical protein
MVDNVSTEVRALVVAVIAKLWEDGCPVASRPEEMAPIAIRRWLSSSRRGLDSSDLDGRIRDLTKGLIAHFEDDRYLVGPLVSDYEHVATAISKALRTRDGG